MEEKERIASFFERYATRLGKWDGLIHFSPPPEAEARARVEAGRPWVDSAVIEVAPEQASRILSEILEDLQSDTAEETEDLSRVHELTVKGELQPAELLRAALSADSSAVDQIAIENAVPPPLLHFLGAYLARPFLAAAVRGFDPESVNANRATATCPACGRVAVLAFLMPEGGQRRLWCRSCGTDWPVQRLKCPSCGNRDQQTLGYFTVEGDEERRVDFCRACQCYLKTADLREFKGEQPLSRADLEDLLSEKLDTAALHEGFVPMAKAGDA